MNQSFNKTTAAVLLAALSLALGACGTTHVSRDISPQGIAGEVLFPSVDKIVLREGTFPTMESLRAVGPGVTKDQLYQLLGRPHFREGYAGVREWDYLFHFRKDGKITTCQYKVIFDENYLAQSFHSAPQACADLLAEAKPTEVIQYDLSADALFAFGRHGLNDILPTGREQLTTIAGKLQQAKEAAITVVGHTDNIGSDADNQLLSQHRAQTVRGYLVQQGVSASAITAEGRGESEPVKQCDPNQSRADLIVCLAPNRRVQITATGSSPK